jgi:hypothetical protein
VSDSCACIFAGINEWSHSMMVILFVLDGRNTYACYAFPSQNINSWYWLQSQAGERSILQYRSGGLAKGAGHHSSAVCRRHHRGELEEWHGSSIPPAVCYLFVLQHIHVVYFISRPYQGSPMEVNKLHMTHHLYYYSYRSACKPACARQTIAATNACLSQTQQKAIFRNIKHLLWRWLQPRGASLVGLQTPARSRLQYEYI